MTQSQCAPCLGSGLVGSGPEPWNHVGAIHTCAACTGTGKVSDSAPAPKGIVATVVDAVKSAVSEAL